MIYLLRHGQTAHNAERRIQGHVDVALNDQGLAQARAMATALRGLIADPDGWRLAASPLGRARQTAAMVGEALGLQVEIEPRLKEITFGEWEGRTRAELEALHPQAFGDTGWAFRAPMGETYEATADRLRDWLDSLAPEPQRKVIAVSHGVAGRVLRGLYLGLPREEALAQPVPQDAIFRLAGGTLERIDCEAAG